MLFHSRRTTRGERLDYGFIRDMLKLNMGKGYYSFADLAVAPVILSDASDSRKYSGGGWVSACGNYDFYVYKGRQAIDYKEGDTVLRACESMGPLWKGCVVPFGIDNSVIQRSVAKGRSGVERLNELMKQLFILQVKFDFILSPFWISSEDNYLSDHLSRDREFAFLALVHTVDFLSDTSRPIRRMDGAGRIVQCDRPGSMTVLRQLLAGYSSNVNKDGAMKVILRLRGGMPSRGAGVGGDAQLLSIAYTPASLFEGLPVELVPRLELVLDNRLAPSSRAHVVAASKRWSAFCEGYQWDPLLGDTDTSRGGKIAAWVMSMMDETELVYKSIENYIWGMRTWQKLQGKSDPCMGIRGWRDFMRGISVMTAVPSEPRAAVPLDVIRKILQGLQDSSEFADIQLHLVMLVLLFTFSRTECPCPKAWTGPNAFDPEQHWMTEDFALRQGSKGWVLWVRFKRIKQDPRVERPSMVHADSFLPSDLATDGGFGHDFVPVGDVPDDPLFSVKLVYQRFVKAVGQLRGSAQMRPRTESMFLNRDLSKPYTYSCLMADFKRWCVNVGCDASLGPHGLRVTGYNLSKAGNGEDLTVVHGGWKSAAHSRYERFLLPQILGIPAGMLGYESRHAGPRDVSRSRARRGVGVGAQVTIDEELAPEALSDGDDDAGADTAGQEPPDLPPGYTRVDFRRASGKADFKVLAPDGTNCRTMANAWRHASSQSSPSRAVARTPQARVRASPRVPATSRASASSQASATSQASPARAGARTLPAASPRPCPAGRARPSSVSFTPTPSTPVFQGSSYVPFGEPEAPRLDPSTLPVSEQPVEDLADATVSWDRPSARRGPRERTLARE